MTPPPPQFHNGFIVFSGSVCFKLSILVCDKVCKNIFYSMYNNAQFNNFDKRSISTCLFISSTILIDVSYVKKETVFTVFQKHLINCKIRRNGFAHKQVLLIMNHSQDFWTCIYASNVKYISYNPASQGTLDIIYIGFSNIVFIFVR